MRFRKKALDQMGARIVEMGLSECPVCHTGAILISRLPAMVYVGGIHHEPGHPRHDPEANAVFAVRLTCDVCGYMLLFDSEKFYSGDEKIMFLGPQELEDQLESAEEE
jgi:hypothetical protein